MAAKGNGGQGRLSISLPQQGYGLRMTSRDSHQVDLQGCREMKVIVFSNCPDRVIP